MRSPLIFTNIRKRTLVQVAVLALSCFIFCAMSFLSPVVNIDYFSDLGNYFTFWGDLNNISFGEAIGRFEPGFVLLCKLCSIAFSFSAFMWFVQFAVFYSLFLFGFRYTSRIFVAALLAIACLFFYLPITSMATLVLRQGLASVIFFCFLTRYHGGSVRWSVAMPWVISMVSFHYSSAFVVIAFILLPYVHGMRAFYLWCIAMVLYCFDVSGQVGMFFYSSMGLNVASLNALSYGADYQVGFKINFLLLNAFYVISPLILVMLGIAKISIRAIFSDNLFRLYFVLNSLATVFSLMPFYDRFFMWSWAIGPVILLAVLSARGKRVSRPAGMTLAG